MLTKMEYSKFGGVFQVYRDTEKERAEMDYTNQLALDTTLKPRPVEFVKFKQNIFTRLFVVNMFDDHSGSIGANAEKQEKAWKFIETVANAVCIYGGDMINSIINGDQNQHDDKTDNAHTIRRLIEKLTPIKHKILAILDGNHDGEYGRRHNRANSSPVREVWAGLCTYDPVAKCFIGPQHCKAGLIITYEMPTADNKRLMREIIEYDHHGSSKGGAPGSSTDESFKKSIAIVSAVLGKPVHVVKTGHVHDDEDALHVQEEVQYDENHRAIGVKEIQTVVISEPTLQEEAPYGHAQQFAPVESNVYIDSYRIVRNPLFGKAHPYEPEYKLELSRIPMFRQNSNEFTNEALEIMELYKEPDIQKYVKKFTKSSTPAIMRYLENQVKNYGTKDFIDKKDLNSLINDDLEEDDVMEGGR